MPKVRYEKIVRAERGRVFGIATDYESLQRTMPRYFPSVRVRSSRDNVTIVEEHVRLSGRELVVMAKHVVCHPSVHEVFVIGGDAKGSRIVERYEAIPGGTRITVDADIRPGVVMGLAGFFGKGRVRSGLAEITGEIARLAEG